MFGPIITRNKRCPHEAAHECPLYVASHYGDGIGCAGGGDGINCAVDTGEKDYHAETARFYAAHPDMLEKCPPAHVGPVQ